MINNLINSFIEARVIDCIDYSIDISIFLLKKLTKNQIKEFNETWKDVIWNFITKQLDRSLIDENQIVIKKIRIVPGDESPTEWTLRFTGNNELHKLIRQDIDKKDAGSPLCSLILSMLQSAIFKSADVRVGNTRVRVLLN